MIFRKCDETDIGSHWKALSDLFVDVYRVNFPGAALSNDFGHERVLNLLRYIEDDSAIVYGAFEDNTLARIHLGIYTESKRGVTYSCACSSCEYSVHKKRYSNKAYGNDESIFLRKRHFHYRGYGNQHKL